MRRGTGANLSADVKDEEFDGSVRVRYVDGLGAEVDAARHVVCFGEALPV
jgi:hypothetical protein